MWISKLNHPPPTTPSWDIPIGSTGAYPSFYLKCRANENNSLLPPILPEPPRWGAMPLQCKV